MARWNSGDLALAVRVDWRMGSGGYASHAESPIPIPPPSRSIYPSRQRLIRAIRGRRSQAAINRRLGFSFNQVSRWETGRTKIGWLEFIQFCAHCGFDVNAIVATHFHFPHPAAQFDRLLHWLIQDNKVGEMALKVGVSRFTLMRWLNGSVCPSLGSMLHIFSQCSDVLVDFVLSFATIEHLPSIRDEATRIEALRSITYLFPETLAVFDCMSLHAYKQAKKHEPGFIAAKIGISLEREILVLDALQRAGLLKKVRGKFMVGPQNYDINSNFSGKNRVRTYWADRGLSALRDLTQRSREI